MSKNKDVAAILDDRHEYYNPYLSACSNCKHYNEDFTCPAFPKGIPTNVLSGENLHKVVLDDQNGDYTFTL